MSKPIRSLSGISKKKTITTSTSTKPEQPSVKVVEQEPIIEEGDYDEEWAEESPEKVDIPVYKDEKGELVDNLLDAFKSILDIMDLVYFSSKNMKVCEKKFSKDCFFDCQSFWYCKAKQTSKDIINKL